MPTPSERKAFLFLAAVVALGASVRIVRAVSGESASDAASASALRDQLRRVDSAQSAVRTARSKRGTRRKPASAQSPVPVDMDTASAELMETLNGIGPTLAAKIVAHRDSFGAFGSLEGLQRVRGVGPALAARLAPHVTFSRLPRPQNAVIAPPPGRRKAPRRARTDRSFP